MTNRARIILLTLLCCTSVIRAQGLARTTQTDRIIHTLDEAGFENIRAVETERRLVVAYENRRYRYEIRAFREALALTAPYVEEATSVTFIQERDGIPVRSVRVSAEGIDYERAGTDGEQIATFIDASSEIDQSWTALGGASRHTSSYGRFDLVIQPRITAQLGNYGDAVQTQIGLVPELSSTVARGLRLRGQVILPIQNDLEDEGDYVRPGIVSIGQVLRLPRNAFVAVSAGYFTANRYGIDLQGRVYLGDARFAVGGRMGITGFAGIREGAWTQSSPGRFTASLTADYYMPKYTLMVRSSLERFVYGDFGWRVEFARTFREFQLGFFGLVSEGENNAGFRVSIPLFGRGYGRPGAFRVRPARRFDWEYRYRGFPSTGRAYQTGHELDAIWEGVYPAFFESQLETR